MSANSDPTADSPDATPRPGAPMPCRRCFECEGQDHHRIDNPDFGSGDPEAEYPGDVEFLCKHCPATGDECALCGGTGIDDPDFDPVDHPSFVDDQFSSDPIEDFDDCPACDGRGVILRQPPAKGGGL